MTTNNRVNAVRFKRNRYKEMSDYVKTQMNKKEIDDIFRTTGINITTLQYQLFRYSAVLLLIIGLISALARNNNVPNKTYFIIITLYLVSSPTLYFFNRKTPFNYLVDFLKNEYKNKKDIEIYRAITQLKNLAIAQQDKPLGADFIIEQLMKFTNITKSTFSKMLSIWRLGQEEKACEYFAKNIDTKLGTELAGVLLKLDKINPVELKEQLILYQNNVKSEKKTEHLRKMEALSTLIYLPIIGTALIVLLNFVIITIYIDQMQNILGM